MQRRRRLTSVTSGFSVSVHMIRCIITSCLPASQLCCGSTRSPTCLFLCEKHPRHNNIVYNLCMRAKVQVRACAWFVAAAYILVMRIMYGHAWPLRYDDIVRPSKLANQGCLTSQLQQGVERLFDRPIAVHACVPVCTANVTIVKLERECTYACLHKLYFRSAHADVL
jgi:hypothetical protein